MNHVPDEVLSAIDDLGEGLLVGDPRPVEASLRSDLRLSVPVDDDALRAGETPVEFHLQHTRVHDHLRAHGSFVATVVDGVERRLRAWGVEPPERYGYDRDLADGGDWRVYAGQATL